MMNGDGRPHVAVIGGGITGLAAAFHLHELAAERGLPLRVTVIEREPRVGGCVETRNEGGFTMEMGAESLPTEKPWGIDLIDRLGLHDELVATRTEYKGTYVVRGGRLRAIPEDFTLFTPTSMASLVTSRLFSPAGLIRAAMEPFVPARRSAEDESLASFVTRRLGSEILERLAQPLVGGIYSADPRHLSMEATLPRFLQMEQRHGSLLRALRMIRNTSLISTTPNRPPKAPMPRMMSLRAGLGTMVRALEQSLCEDLLLNREALLLRYAETSDGRTRWFVALVDGHTIAADALICTLPAPRAAHLLATAHPQLTTLLESIKYNSIAVVTLAYDAAALPRLPRGYGFVVPYIEQRHITALTIASQKYPNRAPAGTVLLRAFLGGSLQADLLGLDDRNLRDAVRQDLRDILSIESEPQFTIVRRWPRVLPEYAVGHLQLVDEIDRQAANLPCFALAGSAYRGVGVSDCIRSGEAAAENVLAALIPAEARGRENLHNVARHPR